MKGLRKVLTPFAPDQSGAVSVLYALGGAVIFVDAGGCTGNICGFDEPRFETQAAAVFSAGLRDMDAILGRDQLLVDKAVEIAESLHPKFVALVGTPVPAVIGTDLKSLCRLIEKKSCVPAFAVATNGFKLYDAGCEQAFWTLFKKFCTDRSQTSRKGIGLLGATPFDCDLDALDAFLEAHAAYTAYGWSQNEGLDTFADGASAERSVVVAPDGLKAAKWLNQHFGVPYKFYDPMAAQFAESVPDVSGKRILAVHQQVAVDSARQVWLARGAASVTGATWFMSLKELAQPSDLKLKEEDDFERAAAEGGYDIIAADPTLKPLAKRFAGQWIDWPHFAISGKRLNPHE